MEKEPLLLNLELTQTMETSSVNKPNALSTVQPPDLTEGIEQRVSLVFSRCSAILSFLTSEGNGVRESLEKRLRKVQEEAIAIARETVNSQVKEF